MTPGDAILPTACQVVSVKHDQTPDVKVGGGRIAINCTVGPQNSCAIDCTPSCMDITALQAPPSLLSDLLSHSTSHATKRAYRADMAHYEAFGGTIPGTPDHVALYVAHLSQTHKPATIARRLAAVGKVHRVKGYPDPTKSEIVKAALRGVRRTQGIAQQEARPLLKEDLFDLLAATGDRPKDIRDRALLLVGFAGGFRRSELVGLDVGDVEFVRQGMVITLRRSKTDQEGQGRKVGIPLGRGRWCPVKALEAWLAASGIFQGPVFRVVNRHGHVKTQRLSGEAVSLIIKSHLAKAGHPAEGFSGHSLRAGFATSAAMAGASTYKIRQQTGHASDAMLARYIRDGDIFTNNAAASVL